MKLPARVLNLLLLLAGLGLAACSPSPTPAVPGSSEFDDRLAAWLQARQGKIVRDAEGVGVAGKAPRFRGRMRTSLTTSKGQVMMQVEFRVQLPQGASIVEECAGLAKTEGEAAQIAFDSFANATLPALCQAFLQDGRGELPVQRVTIGGRDRPLITGPTYVFGTSTSAGAIELNLAPVLAAATLPAQPGPIWGKILCSQRKGGRREVEVHLNGTPDAALAEAIGKLAWPAQPESYLAKIFFILP